MSSIASIADRMSSMAGKKAPEHQPGHNRQLGHGDPSQTESGGKASTTLHDHGDGSYHTEGSDGEKVEHPDIGHALMHMAGKHSDGEHMHAHKGEDGSLTSHQVGEDKQVQGPHNHENIEALKDHMGKFLNEEEGEWKGQDYGGGGHAKHGGGGHESLFG
jgi:hypothetical protein